MWLNLILVSLFYCYALALTDEEAKVEFVKRLMTCTKEHPVEMSELFQLEKHIVPKNPETKCLLACVFRSEGTMNKEGLYDLEVAYNRVKLIKNGDENRELNGKKIADICVKVNDIQVSDGEKGCERAVLMFKCLTENAPKFGFKI